MSDNPNPTPEEQHTLDRIWEDDGAGLIIETPQGLVIELGRPEPAAVIAGAEDRYLTEQSLDEVAQLVHTRLTDRNKGANL